MTLFLADWYVVLTNPDSNGLTIFISGFLMTLALYHFLLFFQHRAKLYLYYSLYAFLLFIYLFQRADHFILAEKVTAYQNVLDFVNIPIQWTFHGIYLLFVKTFVNLKENRPKWNRILNISLLIYSILLFILMIVAYMVNNPLLMDNWFLYFYLPTMSVLGGVTFFVVNSLNGNIKNYVLWGSFFYFSFGIAALFFAIFGHQATIIFYVGIFLENIFFALGLGAKQKRILNDRNEAQLAVIQEHEINLQLQNRIKTKLDVEVAEKAKEIIALTQRNEQEKRRKLALEHTKNILDLRMRALQTQMNPHFLFNSLNSIKYFIIKEQPEDAVFFLSKLAKLIRKILDNSQKQYTSLGEELEVIELYLDVENIRLNNSILLEQDIDSAINLSKIKIPPLVLQPFIENCIWHGLALKKGEKKIRITLERAGSYLTICIKDNGVGREKALEIKARKAIEKESLGIGLTQARLDAFFQFSKCKVSISFKDLKEGIKPTGTQVIINIPSE